MMHDDEFEIDDALVRRLLRSQAPAHADLPLRRVAFEGSDNAMFRLGDDLVVRLPKRPEAVAGLLAEQAWTPCLAGRLQMPIPAVLFAGVEGEAVSSPWSICQWVKGTPARPDVEGASIAFALDVARFVETLHALPVDGAPSAGVRNHGRGAPLTLRAGAVDVALESARSLIDVDAVRSVWARGLATPVHDGSPVWLHGDLHGSNLIAREGRLAGVVDFGLMGAGDPACDHSLAWTFLDPAPRAVYREALAIGDAAWRRARGWALSIAVIQLPYYVGRDAAMAAMARRTLHQVMSDGA